MNALPASLMALLLTAATLAPATALARSSDRSKPMDIEAGFSDYSLDDSRPTVLTGGVTITQGTLDIQATRADITQSNGEPTRAVLSGGPVRLRQQLDNGKPMDAVAARVDYDLRSEIVVFTGGVRISQPSGSISGERIVYNMRTGQVQGGGDGAGRVRMRIMPRTTGGSDTGGGDAG